MDEWGGSPRARTAVSRGGPWRIACLDRLDDPGPGEPSGSKSSLRESADCVTRRRLRSIGRWRTGSHLRARGGRFPLCGALSASDGARLVRGSMPNVRVSRGCARSRWSWRSPWSEMRSDSGPTAALPGVGSSRLAADRHGWRMVAAGSATVAWPLSSCGKFGRGHDDRSAGRGSRTAPANPGRRHGRATSVTTGEAADPPLDHRPVQPVRKHCRRRHHPVDADAHHSGPSSPIGVNGDNTTRWIPRR